MDILARLQNFSKLGTLGQIRLSNVQFNHIPASSLSSEFSDLGMKGVETETKSSEFVMMSQIIDLFNWNNNKKNEVEAAIYNLETILQPQNMESLASIFAALYNKGTEIDKHHITTTLASHLFYQLSGKDVIVTTSNSRYQEENVGISVEEGNGEESSEENTDVCSKRRRIDESNFSCICKSPSCLDNVKTSLEMWIGSMGTWHGELDMVIGLIEVSIPVKISDQTTISSSEIMRTEIDSLSVNPYDWYQFVGQTIVYSWLENNRRREKKLIPSILIDQYKFGVAFYHPENDVFLITDPLLNICTLDDNGLIINETSIIVLWFIINRNLFLRSNPKFLESAPKSGFRKFFKMNGKLGEYKVINMFRSKIDTPLSLKSFGPKSLPLVPKGYKSKCFIPKKL